MPGQLEQVTDQTVHSLDGDAHLAQGRVLILDHPVLEALSQGPESGQRGTQVVGHEGHQLPSALFQCLLTVT